MVTRTSISDFFLAGITKLMHLLKNCKGSKRKDVKNKNIEQLCQKVYLFL